VAIDNNRRLVTIEMANKSRETFIVDKNVRAKADKDTSLAGRKNLTLLDYKTGQRVTASCSSEDGKITEIRLKRSRT
jgi:predicted lipoprotein with Yx(FWY)xxD motif